MREIKFRAWDKDKNRMCRVVNVQPNDDGSAAVVTLFANGIETSIIGDNYPKRFELMQFTGLKDKNGKEIYEGDIVNVVSLNDVVEWGERDYEGFYGYTGIGLKYTYEANTQQQDAKAWEVIGNIYENPDLLGKESV